MTSPARRRDSLTARASRGEIPFDHTIMAEMSTMAVDGAEAIAGVALDYGWGSLAGVDEVLEAMRVNGERSSELGPLCVWFGAYVGEVLVRHLGARWHLDPPGPCTAVVLPDGMVANVTAKVMKRLDHGEQDSLVFFADGLRDLVG